jgi:hypothetical protein
MGQIFRAVVMRPFTRRLFRTVLLVLRQLMPNELECPMCERMQTYPTAAATVKDRAAIIPEGSFVSFSEKILALQKKSTSHGTDSSIGKAKLTHNQATYNCSLASSWMQCGRPSVASQCRRGN